MGTQEARLFQHIVGTRSLERFATLHSDPHVTTNQSGGDSYNQAPHQTHLISNQQEPDGKCMTTARQQILDRVTQNVQSKTIGLAAFLAPGQRHPHSLLQWIGPIAHQMALSSLFVGDCLLGEHAANYLPSSSYRRAAVTLRHVMAEVFHPIKFV